MKQPVVFAHRGASAYAPENTMASFRKALEMGAGGIELDVQASSDGHLVVIHDEAVDRVSNGKGMIRDKTLMELKSLDFGSWHSQNYKNERIPELFEVLELLASGNVILNIEIKNGPVFYPGIEQKVADAVKSYGMVNRTIISSFNHYSLVKIRKADPEMRTAILYVAGLYEPWVYAKHVGAEAINPLFYNIVPEVMKGCIENGIKVNPFTVDGPEHIKSMALAGVDGIITNVPDVAIKTINELGGKIRET